MDQAKANEECSRRDQAVFDKCPQCKMKIILHCSDCRIQVSGCLDTEVDRFGNDEAWKRAVDRMGEEMARQRYRDAGLFVPESRN